MLRRPPESSLQGLFSAHPILDSRHMAKLRPFWSASKRTKPISCLHQFSRSHSVSRTQFSNLLRCAKDPWRERPRRLSGEASISPEDRAPLALSINTRLLRRKDWMPSSCRHPHVHERQKYGLINQSTTQSSTCRPYTACKLQSRISCPRESTRHWPAIRAHEHAGRNPY